MVKATLLNGFWYFAEGATLPSAASQAALARSLKLPSAVGDSDDAEASAASDSGLVPTAGADTERKAARTKLRVHFWILSKLRCCVLFWAVSLALRASDLRTKRDDYAAMLKTFPPPVAPYTGNFAVALFYGDCFVLAVTVLAFAAVVTTGVWWGNCCRSGARHDPAALRTWARRAWAAVFVAPFLVLFCVPFRSTVDWDGIIFRLCNTTFGTIFGEQRVAGGVEVSADFLRDPLLLNGARNAAAVRRATGLAVSEQWAPGGGGAAAFCTTKGSKWADDFFSAHGEAQFLKEQLYKCTQMTPPCGGRMAKVCAPEICTVPASKMRALSLFVEAAGTQAQSATTVLFGSEYMLGVVMGAYATQMLLPIALSLLNGAAAALANLKVLVPGSAGVGWAMVLAGLLNGPLYAALLAAMYQVLGAPLLVPAFLLLLLSQSAPGACGRRLAAPLDVAGAYAGNRRVMLARNGGLLGGLVLTFLWAYQSDLLQHFDFGSLLTTRTVAALAASTLANSLLTQAVALDLCLRVGHDIVRGDAARAPAARAWERALLLALGAGDGEQQAKAIEMPDRAAV